MNKINKSAYLVLADGFEEIEAITVIDFLRRGGIEVLVLGVNKARLKGSHGIVVEADWALAGDESLCDALVLPGGSPGSENLAASQELGKLLDAHFKNDRLIAAICAAPSLVLGPCGILRDRRYTCFPDKEDASSQGIYTANRVEVDGRLITSKAVGTSAEFSLAIIEALLGSEAAKQLEERTFVIR